MSKITPTLQGTKEQLLDELGEGIVETFDPGLKRAFDVADNEVPKELRDPKKLQMLEGMFKISGDGVFYTLQGEGPTMGEPATFLRLHICNLRCVWCDAFYTWNPKSVEFWKESENWSIEETAKRLKESWTCDDLTRQKRVVITGGEPLLQKDNIDKLMDMLPDWIFEIETNGTIMPTEKQLSKIQFNCSPKLENSHNIKASRIKPDVLLALNKVNSNFKFVVMQPKELDEIEQDYLSLGLDRHKVILMPQGVTEGEVNKNARILVEYAKKKGFRMLGRLQVSIWGAIRRV